MIFLKKSTKLLQLTLCPHDVLFDSFCSTFVVEVVVVDTVLVVTVVVVVVIVVVVVRLVVVGGLVVVCGLGVVVGGLITRQPYVK